jgi:phage gp29-like protein
MPSALSRSITRFRSSDYRHSVFGAHLSPESLRWALDQGADGDLAAQNDLFNLMEDTWDRLRGNLERLKKAVCKLPFTIQPWTEKGREPTAQALEKAKFVEHVLHNQRAPTWEGRFNFNGTVHQLLDAVARGVSVLEVEWEIVDGRLVPVATRRVPWQCLGFDRRPDAPEPYALRLFPDRDKDNPRRFSEFPHKFLVGVYGAKSGLLGETAQLRALAPLWLGRMLGWEWLLSRAELFGMPIRWATYDPSSTADQIAAVNNMLANMGSAAWGSFPAGTNLEVVSGAVPGVAGPNEPTERLMSLADTACDRLFLGATLTSSHGDSGSYAMANVHREIELDLYENYAAYVIDVLNNQLISSIVALNWGDTRELPFLEVELQRQEKDRALAERDRILFQEMRLPVSTQWLYDRHKVPAPGPGDDLFQPENPAPTQGRDASPRRPRTTELVEAASDAARQRGDGQRREAWAPKAAAAGAIQTGRPHCGRDGSQATAVVEASSESTASLLARQAAARALLESLLQLARVTRHVVVWTAVLDDRTTPYCQQMHGRVYGDGWTEPPPAHHNCRSRLMLVPEDEHVPPPPLEEAPPRPS